MRALAASTLRSGARTFNISTQLLPHAALLLTLNASSAPLLSTLATVSAWSAADVAGLLARGSSSAVGTLSLTRVSDAGAAASFFVMPQEAVALSLELWGVCPGWSGGAGSDAALGVPLQAVDSAGVASGAAWLLPFSRNVSGTGVCGLTAILGANGAATRLLGAPAVAARASMSAADAFALHSVSVVIGNSSTSGASVAASVPRGSLRAGWVYRVFAPTATDVTIRLATPSECVAGGGAGSGTPAFAPPTSLDGASAGSVLTVSSAAGAGGPLLYVRAPPIGGALTMSATSGSQHATVFTVLGSGWMGATSDFALTAADTPSVNATAAHLIAWMPILTPVATAALVALVLNGGGTAAATAAATSVGSTECTRAFSPMMWSSTLTALSSALALGSSNAMCEAVAGAAAASLARVGLPPLSNPQVTQFLRMDYANASGAWSLYGGTALPWALAASAGSAGGVAALADSWPGIAAAPSCASLSCTWTFSLGCGALVSPRATCSVRFIVIAVDEWGGIGGATSPSIALVAADGGAGSSGGALAALSTAAAAASICSASVASGSLNLAESCLMSAASAAAAWGALGNRSSYTALGSSDASLAAAARASSLESILTSLVALDTRNLAASQTIAMSTSIDGTTAANTALVLSLLSSPATEGSSAWAPSAVLTTAARQSALIAVATLAKATLPLDVRGVSLPPLGSPSAVLSSFSSATAKRCISTIAGIFEDAATESNLNGLSAWGSAAPITPAEAAAAETAARSLSAAMTRGLDPGAPLSIAAAPAFALLQTCSLRGAVVLSAARIAIATATTLDASASLPPSCGHAVRDGGFVAVSISAVGATAASRENAAAAGSRSALSAALPVLALMQWGAASPVTVGAAAPGALPTSLLSMIQSRRASTSTSSCQTLAAARNLLALPQTPDPFDVLSWRAADTPTASLWLSGGAGGVLVTPLAITFTLSASDAGIASAAAVAMAAAPRSTTLPVAILAANTSTRTVDDPGSGPFLAAAASYVPASLSLNCPTSYASNSVIAGGARVSVAGSAAPLLSRTNVTVLSPSANATVSRAVIRAGLSALSSVVPSLGSVADTCSHNYAPLCSAPAPLTLSVPPATLESTARLSVSCATAAVDTDVTPWLRPREIDCGPGAEGASIVYECPALVAAPLCPVFASGQWSYSSGCTASISSTGAFVCSCAADSGAVLLAGGSVIAGRWATIDAPARESDPTSSGLFVVGGSIISRSTSPLQSTGAPALWGSVVALTIVWAAAVAVALRSDAAARVRFASALAADEGIVLGVRMTALAGGGRRSVDLVSNASICCPPLFSSRRRAPFSSLIPSECALPKSAAFVGAAASELESRALASDWAFSRPQAIALLSSLESQQGTPRSQSLAALLLLTRALEHQRMDVDALTIGWPEGARSRVDGAAGSDSSRLWNGDSMLELLDPCVAAVIRETLLPQKERKGSVAFNRLDDGDEDEDDDENPYEYSQPTKSRSGTPIRSRARFEEDGDADDDDIFSDADDAGSGDDSDYGYERQNSSARLDDDDGRREARNSVLIDPYADAAPEEITLDPAFVRRDTASQAVASALIMLHARARLSMRVDEHGKPLSILSGSGARAQTRREYETALRSAEQKGCVQLLGAVPIRSIRSAALFVFLCSAGRSGVVARCSRATPLICAATRERACVTPCAFSPSRSRALRVTRVMVMLLALLTASTVALLSIRALQRFAGSALSDSLLDASTAVPSVSISGSAAQAAAAAAHVPARAALAGSALVTPLLNATAKSLVAGALSPGCGLGFLSADEAPPVETLVASLPSIPASYFEIIGAGFLSALALLPLAAALVSAESTLGRALARVRLPFIYEEEVVLAALDRDLAPSLQGYGTPWITSLLRTSRSADSPAEQGVWGARAFHHAATAALPPTFQAFMSSFGSALILTATLLVCVTMFVATACGAAVWVVATAPAIDSRAGTDALTAWAISAAVFYCVLSPAAALVHAFYSLAVGPALRLAAAAADEDATSASENGLGRKTHSLHTRLDARYAGLSARHRALVIPNAIGAAEVLPPERALLAFGSLRDVADAMLDAEIETAGGARAAAGWPSSVRVAALSQRARGAADALRSPPSKLTRGSVRFSFGTGGGSPRCVALHETDDSLRSTEGEVARTAVWKRAIESARAHVLEGGDVALRASTVISRATELGADERFKMRKRSWVPVEAEPEPPHSHAPTVTVAEEEEMPEDSLMREAEPVLLSPVIPAIRNLNSARSLSPGRRGPLSPYASPISPASGRRRFSSASRASLAAATSALGGTTLSSPRDSARALSPTPGQPRYLQPTAASLSRASIQSPARLPGFVRSRFDTWESYEGGGNGNSDGGMSSGAKGVGEDELDAGTLLSSKSLLVVPPLEPTPNAFSPRASLVPSGTVPAPMPSRYVVAHDEEAIAYESVLRAAEESAVRAAALLERQRNIARGLGSAPRPRGRPSVRPSTANRGSGVLVRAGQAAAGHSQ